jgi:hypothetical protein
MRGEQLLETRVDCTATIRRSRVAHATIVLVSLRLHRSTTENMRMYLRFVTGLPRFFRTPVTLDHARAAVAARLQGREERLLSIFRQAVFARPGSPYLALMRMAGCEYGDVERMVIADGLEMALARLAQSGVWLSFDEFKGRQRIVRGSWSLDVSAADYDSPLSGGHIVARSGGGNGPGTRTVYDLAHIGAARSVYKLLTFDAFGVSHLPVIMWSPVAPGYGPLELLAHAGMGKPPLHWFSPVAPRPGSSSTKDRLITRYLALASRMAGARLPSPQHTPPSEVWTVTKSVLDTRARHGGCVVLTDPSGAVRICQSALARNEQLDGVLFMVGGEPVTHHKLAFLEQAGARWSPLFVFIEGGYVGIGCLNPAEVDEVHLLSDSVALIQHRRGIEHARQDVDAFLFTTLLPTAPKVLINVESGDWGRVHRRECGCYFERLGFHERISTIRSFDKFTSAGMNVTASSLLHIVEEMLPAAFGGTLLDYQLREEEGEDGLPRITVVIDPTVGSVDESAVVDAIFAELLRHGKRGALEQTWRATNTFRVVRESPQVTARGKLLPLHVKR